jgi:hypothetical protein
MWRHDRRYHRRDDQRHANVVRDRYDRYDCHASAGLRASPAGLYADKLAGARISLSDHLSDQYCQLKIAETAGGPGLFTVNQFTACSSATTISAVQSFYATQLPAQQHGWMVATQFPADGGLMTACGATCFWNPKGGNIYYLVFDQFTDHGAGVVTYRGRWAAFDISTLPTCSANFNASNPGAQRMVYFVGSGDSAFPVPPLSAIAPDDASGGVRGYDICSSGDVTSVTAFLTTEVPAAGWIRAPASDAHCINTTNCWTKNGHYWSWRAVTDPTLWMISYRQPL